MNAKGNAINSEAALWRSLLRGSVSLRDCQRFRPLATFVIILELGKKSFHFVSFFILLPYRGQPQKNGVDLPYIQAMQWHESRKNTEIYTHVTIKGFDQIESPLNTLDF